MLRQIEALVGCRLCDRFDLIFGTSTGSIIGAMLALGHSVEEIFELYNGEVLTVVGERTKRGKSAALAKLADSVFADKKFDAVKTGVGVVTTRWVTEKPMIFKGSVTQAHGSAASFVPGFGVSIGEAVQASCSAYPFFMRKTVTTSTKENVELIDGGYCANNPTLYAIADALVAMEIPSEKVRVVSVGVGEYPPIRRHPLQLDWWLGRFLAVQLLQKTLEINTRSMDQLRHILFKHVPTVRINKSYSQPEMATNLFERNLGKLNILTQRGTESFAEHEAILKEFML